MGRRWLEVVGWRANDGDVNIGMNGHTAYYDTAWHG